MTRIELIQKATLAALMHVKPDYRSPKRLDDAARVIAEFVDAELRADDAKQMEGFSPETLEEFRRMDEMKTAKIARPDGLPRS